MRILFTRQLPLDAPGGETSHLLAIAKEMQQMGVEVYLMPVTNHPTPDGIWPSDHIFEVKPFGIHRILDSFAISKAVAKFVEECPVDAVLSWQYETAYLSCFIKDRPFIHGMVAAAPFGLLKRKARANWVKGIIYNSFHFRQLRKSEIIFCPSHFAKSEIVNNFRISADKIVVTHLCADEIFQPSQKNKMGPLCNFIFSGSLIPLKGVFDAIEALAMVHQRGYNEWQLKIAGWGDIKKVQKLARKRGIEDHLHYLGGLDRAALASELSEADLAILPSHTDNFGLSIAEAQACALPVVSYRVGGIPEEVIDGKTAILVDLYNVSQLADAVIYLIEHPEQARNMGILGQKNMRDKFSWQNAAELMIKSLQNQ